MLAVLYVAFPYLALALAIGGGLYRHARHRFSFSSRSSELVDKRALFWGSVPWHFGILFILIAHLAAGLFPGAWRRLVGTEARLFVLEAVGLALALYTAWGLALLIGRRLRPAGHARRVTSTADWILLALLALQVVTGIAVAASQRWGSRWYTETAAPWFWSLVLARPRPGLVSALPGLAQLHFLTGFLVIALFPFTRLVHLVSVPLGYLWRPYQLFIWDRAGHRARGGRRGGDAWRADLLGHGEWQSGARPVGAGLAEPPGSGLEVADRRRFLTRVAVGVSSLAALIVAVPAVGFLLGLRRVPRVWRSVGRVDAFKVGSTVEVAIDDSSPLPWAGVTARTAVWLRRVSEREFIAFAVNCTHLGCPVRWLPDAELFMCPCHGGVFYHDGRVAAGPPPKPLNRYPVQVRDGEVQVMTSPLPT